MKIGSIHIGSFGVIKDLDIDNVEPGFNVIFGENESGKTTIMEFVRSTMFPGKQRKNYPTYSKNDFGSIRMTMTDGTSKIIERGDPPITDLVTPQTYRSVFAMTPDDLRDSSIISSGDIRRRFLTIPGGKELPNVVEDINKQMLGLLTTDRRSNNTLIGSRISRLEMVTRELADVTGPNERYDGLFSEHSEIEKELLELKAKKSLIDDMVNKKALQTSQIENVNKLEDLKKRIAELSDSDIVKDGDKETYDDLKFKLGVASSRYSDLESKREMASSKLGDHDPDKIIQNSARIRDLSNNVDRIDELYRQRSYLRDQIEKDEMSVMHQHEPSTKMNGRVKTNEMIIGTTMIAVGTLIAVSGLLFTFYPLLIGSLLIPVGAYVIYRSKSVRIAEIERSPLNGAAMSRLENNRSDLQRVNDNIDAIEREIPALSVSIGVQASSHRESVRSLADLLEKSIEYKRCASDANDASMKMKECSLELKEFTVTFGGEERFLELHSDKMKRAQLTIQYNDLEKSISSSGYDPNLVFDEELPDPTSISNLISEYDRKLGEKRSEMRSILNDENIERLIDEKTRLTAEIEDLSKKWGILSLSTSLIDSACEDLYSNVQPGVIQTADRYIGIMTGGRYGLNSDPRNNDVSVISKGISKTEEQWSSGLGDQVKLSIKLAIARELSSEDLPILLDDVLLMFDHNRRKGGCAVLADISRDMQVLLFTCDREVRDLAVEAGANLICCGGS